MECFVVEGFKVTGVRLFVNDMIAYFDMDLICTSVTLYTADTTVITTDTTTVTVDSV